MSVSKDRPARRSFSIRRIDEKITVIWLRQRIQSVDVRIHGRIGQGIIRRREDERRVVQHVAGIMDRPVVGKPTEIDIPIGIAVAEAAMLKRVEG